MPTVTFIEIRTKIIIENFETEVLAVVDTRASNIVIQQELIPEKYYEKAYNVRTARQMDGNTYTYDTTIHNSILQFEINNNHCTSPYIVEEIYVRNFPYQMILGLAFVLQAYHGMILTRIGLHF